MALELSPSAVEPLWQAAFGEAERPQLYKAASPGNDGFAPLSDPQSFIKELHGMSRGKLYALAANGQLALKLAQDEYLAIDKIIKRVKEQESTLDPQTLEDPEVFEAEKEATLYGYKYVPAKPALLNGIKIGEASEPAAIPEVEKREVHLFADPMAQGGFYPLKWKNSDYQKLKAAAPNPNNIDGWEPVLKDGKKLVPRANPRKPYWQEELDVYKKKSTHRRKPVEFDGPDEDRPGTSSSADSVETPSRAVNKPLTRFKGTKVPPTRDVSETPSTNATPRGRRQNTPIIAAPGTPIGLGSPGSKRRRLNPTPKSTTRAREIEVTTAAQITMSREELFEKKWDANELMAAVSQNHAWLSDDPVRANNMKNKILTSKFPVRTFSMYKKWQYWKKNDQAKRPRRGKGNGKGVSAAKMPEAETEESEDDIQDVGEDESNKHVNGDTKEVKALDDATDEEIEVAVLQQIKLQIPGAGLVKQEGGRIGSSSPNTPTRRSKRNSRRASG
jgi:hypothetical protein